MQEKVKAKNRARKRARYALEKKGRVRVGDGLDVDHRDGNAHNNSPSNLRVVPKSTNRSYARTKSAKKKNKTS